MFFAKLVPCLQVAVISYVCADKYFKKLFAKGYFVMSRDLFPYVTKLVCLMWHAVWADLLKRT